MSRWGSGGSRIKVVVVVVTSSLVATSLIVICMGQPPGIGGLTRTHTHKYPYPHTHVYPLSQVPSMGVQVYPSSSWRALACCRRHGIHRPSSIDMLCVVIIVVMLSCVVVLLWSLCHRRHDAMALAICVTAASLCRPSSVNIVHHALMCCASCVDVLCILRRVSACHCGRCVVDVVMPWHWPCASWQRHRVVHHPSTSCIVRRCVMRCCASCIMCQRVVVVMSSVDVSCVVVMPWQWPSALCHCHRVTMSSVHIARCGLSSS